MEITIKYGQELSVENFKAILELDLKIFGKEILTNEGMAVKRFLKFKDSIIAAYAGNTLAGFLCFFCVDPSVYERALSQKEYVDDNLSESDVKALTKEGGNHILLFDFVIDEPFRSQGIAGLILDFIRDYLKQKNDNGYIIDRLFGFAISIKGFQILSSLGGREIWAREEIVFLEIDKEIFLRRL